MVKLYDAWRVQLLICALGFLCNEVYSLLEYGYPAKRKYANGLEHQTQALNASTNGGDASRVGHFSEATSRVGFLQPRPAELKQRLADERVISAVCEPLFCV